MVKRKKYDFDQWLIDNSKVNSELVKENQDLSDICEDLFKQKIDYMNSDILSRYELFKNEVTDIRSKRADLISLFNKGMNDYWRGRRIGEIEKELTDYLDLLITLSNRMKTYLDECVNMLASISPPRHQGNNSDEGDIFSFLKDEEEIIGYLSESDSSF